MPDKHCSSLGIIGSVVLLLLALLAGCGEVMKVSEDVARLAGGERAAGVVRGAGTATSGLLPISYEEEQSLGASLALQVASRYNGLYDNPALTRYVNLVGQAVALTSDRPNIEYHFAILDHDSINAFATAAGYVFITRGLIKQLQSEAELAAVLGHEIGHISEKHILGVIQRSKLVAAGAEVGSAALGQNPQLFKGIVDFASKKLLDEGLDQGDELKADGLGAVFAARVGYDPRAYVTLLQRLRALKGDDQAFFKTHPNFSARLQDVQKSIATLKQPLPSVLLSERFIRQLRGQI